MDTTNITPQNIAQYLDFANHHIQATKEDINKLCDAVKQYGFNSAFVNPYWVKYAKSIMVDKKVGTVVAFPLGQERPDIKIAAAVKAIEDGADELDVCSNVGFLKGNQDQEFTDELKEIVLTCKATKPNIVVKIIIESGLLTEEEIKRASQIVLETGADFVKTSSGMSEKPTIEHVKIIKSVVGNKIPIKVAGGVHDFATAKAFLEAGASRVGTSSAVEIVCSTTSDKKEGE